MSFAASGFEDQAGWGVSSPPAGDLVKDALKKEKVLEEVALAQDDLRAMLARVKSVQGDVDKLASGNATLQTYIDNLTVQMAKRR